jgi:hypothetical protein
MGALWIDRLCIIQSDTITTGDEQHLIGWQHRTRIMDSINQNCILNIAAAYGKGLHLDFHH